MGVAEAGELDPSVEDLTSPGGHNSKRRIAVIRTSDRINFKRCRRRWNWQSHIRRNLGPKETHGALWFGSGIHYALEDYHGANVYGRPAIAFMAYVVATRKNSTLGHQRIPADYDELTKLGIGMMDYYVDYWLRNRKPLETFVWNGVPQVEVNVQYEIPGELLPDWVYTYYEKVIYSATFDRVCVDEDGLLWIVDYKTAKRMETLHLGTDPQVGAYCWVGSYLYDRPIAGLIYMQFRKNVPNPPRVLANGRISTAKDQLTSYPYYRSAMVKAYGEDNRSWPAENIECLNYLSAEETMVADKYIRRDRVERNLASHQAEGAKIILEIEEMLDPHLAMYPNPTRDCAYMCPFLNACMNLDDGSDWRQELEINFSERKELESRWRLLLPPPNQVLMGSSKTNQGPEQLFV